MVVAASSFIVVGALHYNILTPLTVRFVVHLSGPEGKWFRKIVLAVMVNE